MQNASNWLQRIGANGARWGLLLALLVSLTSVTIAQTYRGLLRGTVHDVSGGILVGATVTAKSNSTGQTRTATTGSDGTYVIPELDAGEYDVTAQAKDLAQLTLKAVVEVGVDTPLDFSLSKVAGTSTQVTVTAATPLLEASQDVLGGIVEQRLVAELPLNGRDFGKLVALQPGVVVEGSGVAGSVKGVGQFNINGNRDRSNNYTLDGTDDNDPWFNNSALNQVGITGAPATLLPIDAIQEFNLQSQFPAEYGRNSGSVVNIITKSGTNQLHGSAFEYFRNSFFDARNFFNTPPNPQTLFINNQFGGSLGGPVIRDRTFFFGAYEGQRERVGSDFEFKVPTTAERAAARALALSMNPSINPAPLDAILNFFPSSTVNSISGVVNDTNNLDNFIVKVDHKMSAAHSFAARYAFGQNKQTFPFGSLGGFGTGSRLAPFAQISPTRVQVFSASLLSILSASHVNELRFGYSRFRNSFTSADGTFNPQSIGLNFGTGHTGLPEIDFGGVIENLGATGFSIPRARFSQSFQGLDNFTWIRGAHTFKFGGEVRRVAVNAFNDNLERGIIEFTPSLRLPDPVTDALTNYYLGSPCSFCTSANTGNTQRTTYNNGLAFFAQDDYRIRPTLTLNYGLRWEYFGPISEKHGLLSNFAAFSSSAQLQTVGSGGLGGAYQRDLNNFGPRVGLAWNPWPKTVVRAGYGLYYDYIPQHLMIANFTTSAGIATNPTGPIPVLPLNYNQNAFNGSAPGAVFSGSTPPFNIFVTDPNLRTPYVNSWSLNIQHEVAKGAAIEIGYVGSKGTKLTRLYDLNQDLTNPRYFTIDVFSTGANSTYHALQFNTRIQNWHRFSGFSSYVFAKSLDGASDGIDFNFATAAFPQNSDNLRAEKGPSTFDMRHRFTAALNYQVPAWSMLPRKLADGWQLNTIVTAESGQPVPVITGGGSNFHQRPDIVPGVDPILHGSPADGYLNPAAFAAPSPGPFGDLGRDQIYGPGFKNVDFSVTKDTKLTETLNLQFRVEFFNLFNHPNFGLPGGVVNVTPPLTLANCSGCSSTQTPDVEQGNPGLGGGGPRVLQFAIRLAF
ncbi:MAG: carboxypeptidase regulatory-like domain-containing protein [Candidatus Acidiferrales bacterium]